MTMPVNTTSAQETAKLDFLHSEVDENKSSVPDDSDDSLSDGPDFLSSSVCAPVLLTTDNTNDSGADEQSLAGGKRTSQSYYSAQQSAAFSLDSLLTDTKKSEAEEKEIQAMQAELRKGLLSNRGIGVLAEENAAEDVSDEDFTDEQKQTLMMLRLDEDHIQESHPGESVLSHHPCGQLFTQSISPAACGVITSNHSCLGQLLNEYRPDMLMDILSSDIISLAYNSLPCKKQVQRWLFFIMSVHSNAMEVQKCGDLLLQAFQWHMEDVLQGKKVAPNFWTPQISDILQIFINWGASEEDLVFNASAVDPHQLGEVLPLHQPMMEHLAPSHRNFGPVLKMLSCWLQARPSYTTQELNQLLLMLCKLSLDTSLCKLYVLHELQICVASILDCYEASQWHNEVPWLCRKLSTLNNHHHNQVFITELFTPTCPRGQYLQQRLSYLLLYTAVTHQDLCDEDIHSFQLLDLCKVIPGLKRLLQSDNYHLSSLVHLLDLSVGPAAQHITQRKQLQQLLEAVKLIVSEIRDSMQRLDCTKVKGMLLHMCLKWDLAVKASNIRQRKIFSCFLSKTCIQAEQLEDQGPQCNDDDATDDNSTSLSDDLDEQGFTARCEKK